MRRTLVVLMLAAGVFACGIKAPPKPPLEEVAPQPVERPDGGCCKERP